MSLTLAPWSAAVREVLDANPGPVSQFREQRRPALTVVDVQSLRDLEVGIADGRSVPLAQVATFGYGLEESTIWRRDRLPTITVQADLAKGLQAATVGAGHPGRGR